MPSYLLRCGECNDERREAHLIADRDNFGSCPSCGSERERVFEVPQQHVFRARWIEGIDSQPVYVESESQLKGICEKNGCYLEKDDRQKQRQYYESRGMVGEGRRLTALG